MICKSQEERKREREVICKSQEERKRERERGDL